MLDPVLTFLSLLHHSNITRCPPPLLKVISIYIFGWIQKEYYTSAQIFLYLHGFLKSEKCKVSILYTEPQQAH